MPGLPFLKSLSVRCWLELQYALGCSLTGWIANDTTLRVRLSSGQQSWPREDSDPTRQVRTFAVLSVRWYIHPKECTPGAGHTMTSRQTWSLPL